MLIDPVKPILTKITQKKRVYEGTQIAECLLYKNAETIKDQRAAQWERDKREGARGKSQFI